MSVLLLFAVGPVWGAEPAFEAVAPILTEYCVSCHGGEKPKEGLKLGELAPDFAKNGAVWETVYEQLRDGSMPPKGKPQPTVGERATVEAWLAASLTAHEAAKAKTDGRARHRRLNRIEYTNSLRDLLGVAVDIETLPDDGTASGFDNVDAGLDLSSTLMERFLESADAALEAVFVKGPRPNFEKRYLEFAPTNFPEPGLSTMRNATRLSVGGMYRFRINAQVANATSKMTLLVYAGNYGAKSPANRLVGGFDVTDQLTTIEFTIPMAAVDSLRVFPFEVVKMYRKPPDKEAEPGLIIHGVGWEGPLHDVWPPALTTRLLDGRDLSTGKLADAEAIVRRFAPRAFRRPLKDEEFAPYIALLKSRLDNGYSVEDAVRVALKAVLCSPDFLFLAPPPGPLNDFDLATRLSYFLWSSTPDDTLTSLATSGELSKPNVLKAQVERMLNDPKALAFTRNFTGQWLSLRHLPTITPDRHLYPDFDDLLALSMPRETQLFFEEILKDDRSLLEFVHSDWTILNERLATLYNIPDVRGNAFRKIPLPKESHRGGVVTQAAVLMVTANGTNTNPVTRGVWVLDRILGTPPSPPPKDVPAIEPDVRGAVTLREQLVKHKQIESCARCHAQIDPLGNALENFDVIGGWRDVYRASNTKGNPRKMIPTGRGRTTWMHFGPKVDAADELADGRTFLNIDELKALILQNPDQIARGLAGKLMVYATGHPIEFSDRSVIETIVSQVKTKNYGFRTMIHEIVQSETFRNK